MANIDAKKIAKDVGVTPAYVRMIVANTRRPALPLALRIYDKTGVKFGPLSSLNEKQIEVARHLVP